MIVMGSYNSVRQSLALKIHKMRAHMGYSPYICLKSGTSSKKTPELDYICMSSWGHLPKSQTVISLVNLITVIVLK